MKKTQKRVFGLFGLVFVIAVTIFAAFLPVPETQATNQTTDTLTVRVVGSTPAVNISGIASGSVLTSASQEVNIAYENIENLLAVLKFTDVNGNTYEQTILDTSVGDKPIDYAAGISDISINFITGEYNYTYQYYVDGGTATATGSGFLDHYGYGEYVFTVSGDSAEGVPAESSVSFAFVPVSVNINQDGSKVSVDLDYDADEGTGGDGQVAKVVINIYDENGNPVGPSPIVVTPPIKNYTFDMSDYGLPTGTYTVSAQAYDINGNPLYKPFKRQFYYEARRTPVPDTGGVMGDLNISKTDYIITGLIVFSVVGISGAVFISRHDKKTGNRRK